MTEECPQAPDSLADRIREFAWREIELVLTRSGAVSVIRAGDVHERMGLKARLPAVCAALDSKLMSTRYSVEIVRREGPQQGANAAFHFARSDGRRSVSKSSAPMHVSRPSSAHLVEPHPAISDVVSGDTVFLISCVKTKRNSACPAEDLYASDWFRSARAYVESRGAIWLILSAEYGLVNPGKVIAPYEKTLKTMSVAERRRWAESVAASFQVAAPSARRVVFLAGASYREFLVPLLAKQGLRTEAPLSTMRQGEQLSWLKRDARAQPA